MTEPQQSYISRVHLKGYKSIRDTEVTFQPGLNIIIGPNGSGKTNFLEFLAGVLYLQTGFDDIKTSIEIHTKLGDHIVWSLIFIDDYVGSKIINDSISLNDETIKELKYELPYQVNSLKYEREHLEFRSLLFPKVINFDIPREVHLALSSSTNFTIEYNESTNLPDRLLPFKLKGELVHIIAEKLLSLPLSIKAFEDKNSDLIKIDDRFKATLSLYTPIKSLRLKDTLAYTVFEAKVSVNNILLQFKVGNHWLNWEQLSDGTRRIFVIFLEIFSSKGMALLEEPELGIHPDQLNKLMLFLKQQSEEKQIIITTHSPQVLNILEADELNRLIICRHEGEKGTKMVHLSEEEQQWAKEYMQKEPLSEYWTYLGIEAEQIDD